MPILAPQTIRVDLERLNRLKYSTGGLIVNQNQQDSAKKRLQQTVQKFRTNFQQHQQTLNQIRKTLNQIRDCPRIEQDLAKGSSTNLNGLMQSAMEESAQLEESNRAGRISSSTMEPSVRKSKANCYTNSR